MHNSLEDNRKPKKRIWPWIITGFFSVFVVFGFFYLGIQIGNGSLSLSFTNRFFSQNSNLPNKLDYESVNNVYKILKNNYDGQLDEEKLIEGMKKGLLEASGDDYTVYLDKDEASQLKESLDGSFSGIGAELGKEGEFITVVSPISGFPAEKAGLKSKDVIIKINDEDAVGLSVESAVNKIRGEKGSTVKLEVVRDQERLNFDIVRDTITIPSVETKTADGVGYIKISRFGDDTTNLVSQAASDFKSKNIDKIILDLRNNPGGYLNSAVDVSCNWLKSGQKVVDEKRGGIVSKAHSCKQTGPLTGTKTVVLINDGSASASEITAGALKDNQAATIVGLKSYGKGSVQELTNLAKGDLLKITVARWFTPAGKNIDKDGISPDYKIENDANKDIDAQYNKAIELLNN